MRVLPKVIICCEFSGVVRRAFRELGHDAWSCDLLDAEDGDEHHIKGDCIPVIYSGEWDLMIAHPPCRFLAVSGARWFKDRMQQQKEALEFVQKIMDAPINKMAIENPIGVISTKIRKPDFICQPWWFGDPFQKTTCLWLKNLPPLVPTNILPPEQRKQQCWLESPGPDRWKRRSRTYPGFAKAIAEQYGEKI